MPAVFGVSSSPPIRQQKESESRLDELLAHQHVSEHDVRNLLILVFVSNLWTFFMTIIPVVTQVGPQTYYEGHRSWYTGNDVIRFLEPIGGLPLNFVILWKSGIFRDNISSGAIACVLLFLFGAALYEQGAGFHSCSNMIKNAVETIIVDDDTNVPLQNNELENLYYYLKTVWEHAVSHYLYGVGMAIMNFSQFFAFRNHTVNNLTTVKYTKYWIVASSFMMGLLIFGVSIDFPSGTIVGFVYLMLYGMFGIGGYIFHEYHVKKDVNIIVLGNRPLVQHFFYSYCWALAILLLWIAAVGGFKGRHSI